MMKLPLASRELSTKTGNGRCGGSLLQFKSGSSNIQRWVVPCYICCFPQCLLLQINFICEKKQTSLHVDTPVTTVHSQAPKQRFNHESLNSAGRTVTELRPLLQSNLCTRMTSCRAWQSFACSSRGSGILLHSWCHWKQTQVHQYQHHVMVSSFMQALLQPHQVFVKTMHTLQTAQYDHFVWNYFYSYCISIFAF